MIECPATRSQILMHRASDRADFYLHAPPVLWSDEIESWVVSDIPTMLLVLKDKAFAAIDFEAETQRLSTRFGADFSASEQFLKYVPLGQEGDEHAATRRKMAVAINRQMAHATIAFRAFIDGRVPAAFGEERVLDIVSELFAPAVAVLTEALSGVSVAEDLATPATTQMFDRSLSLNRRKVVDRKIRQLVNSSTQNTSLEKTMTNAAAIVIGSDSLLGSIALSFAETLADAPGKRMREIAWNEKFSATAVPYVDRIAAQSRTIAGTEIKQGQRIRLYLDAVGSGGTGSDLDFYFGAGRHVCLGKAVSLQAWRLLVAAFAKVDRVVEVRSLRYRRPDFLFNLPRSMEIEVRR